MSITVYGIPNCDTVKRARQWLNERAVPHAFHDFKKQGVPTGHLARWVQSLGWERLLNRHGTTWRKLDDAVKNGVGDETSAQRLMLQQPSVIKRPVVEWGDAEVTVGFDPDVWERQVARG